VSVRVRRSRLSVGTYPAGSVIVGTCPAKSNFCRDVFSEVGLVFRLVRRGSVNVGTCSAMLA